jgi:hypothetical protein
MGPRPGWAADGALSPVSWLVHRIPMTNTDATVLIRTARHVAQHDATAKALDAGDISAAHATIIGRAVVATSRCIPNTKTSRHRATAPTGFAT